MSNNIYNNNNNYNDDIDYNKNKENKDNLFINIFDKDKKVKRNLELKYNINNSILLEDPKFRSLIITKSWFNTNSKDMYMKLILNPFIKNKDYEKIEKIKQHYENNINTLFYPIFILYAIWIKTLFSSSTKKLNGIKIKFLAISSLPFFFIVNNYYLKPYYLQNKLNKIITEDENLKIYLDLKIEEKLINNELKKYRIKV